MFSEQQKARILGFFIDIKHSAGYRGLRQFVQSELSEDTPDLGGLHSYLVSQFSDALMVDIKEMEKAMKRREL